MWNTDQLGVASWKNSDTVWHFELRGGERGIQLGTQHASESQAEGLPLSIAPVDDLPLPVVSEQYLRGDRLFLNYPQGDRRYAMRFSLQPMQVTAELLVLEFTVSIQTDLLDTHPMLDLQAFGDSEVVSADFTVSESNWRSSVQGDHSGAASVNFIRSENSLAAILLDQRDGPATTSMSSGEELRLRLFGDFLERGVIRTARPWIILNRSGGINLEGEFESWHKALEQRPLPLTS